MMFERTSLKIFKVRVNGFLWYLDMLAKDLSNASSILVDLLHFKELGVMVAQMIPNHFARVRIL